METKWTHGPWRSEPSQYDGEFVITGSNEHGGTILPVLGRTHNFPLNAEANARLIAAAPSLFDALVGLVAQCSARHDGEGATEAEIAELAVARSALLKATGGEA